MPQPPSQESFDPTREPDSKTVVGGRYRLEGSVGRGGMGEVYRARDLTEDRVVALKRFKLDPSKSQEQQRFRREFHTLARLRHPRIVEAYDYGLDGQRPYYTMEMVDGPELSEIAPAPWREACTILRDIASALAFLHTRSLLHRDVAPRNVRCTPDGRAMLLDFGMLATMGVRDEVVGTLPSIPPEMLLGLPVDGRADLFGLGALGYWLTTGRHPGRVRSMDELVRHGRRPPAPPSSLDDTIPAEVDELLLSLLSSEPLARPASAAAVIERLESIANLEPVAEFETAHGYIHSAALVGRRREMKLVRARLQRLRDNAGAAIVVEGASGMGKTRLLREIELEAKLHGALVVNASSDASDIPYALVRQLAEALVATLPDALDRPGSQRVGQLLTPLEMAESTGWGFVPPVETDKREERRQLQASLAEWLCTFGADRPVVLAVDDIQRADEASVAVLAALGYAGHDKAVTVIATLRTDDHVRPFPALDKLREQAVVFRARGLSEAEVEELLSTVFGRTEGLAKLAASIHRVAAGSPMLCTELVRHLVDERVVRYEGGLWHIPDELDESTLPSKLEHAMDARIASLSLPALDIAAALAVHEGELTLAECVALSAQGGEREDAEQEAFGALDELVRKGVVVGTEQRYRMFHDGLTEAAIRSLDPDTRERLELRVAELLLDEGSASPAREARIGWHLLRGGKDVEGAKLLARSGRRLFEATSFKDAVPQLEAALGVYTAQGAQPRIVADLYVMLITAGFYSDRAAVRRHADDAVVVLERLAGLHWARPVGNLVGRWFGLLFGLALAYVVYLVSGRSRTRPTPPDAANDYARAVTYVAGVAGFSFDTPQLRLAVERARPLENTPRPELRAITGFVANLLNFNLGRIGTLLETSDQALAMFEESTDATEVERDMGVGGARFQRGLLAVRSGNPEALQDVDALQQLNRRIWDVGAVQLRAYYHLWRGEESIAKRYRAQLELEHLRLGSLWQLSAVDDSSMALIAANLGDVLGLRRTIVAMERLTEQGMRYQGHLAVARAEYHRLRGEYERATREVNEALAALPEGEGLVRPWALCTRADIELESGDTARAVELAAEAVEYCESPQYGQVPYRFRAARTYALALAQTGKVNEATEEIESLLTQAERNKNPLILGLLHEAMARVAFDDGQGRRAEEHALAMESRLAATRNPVLIARCERLRRMVRPDDFEPVDERELDEMVTEVQAAQTIDAETLADMMSVLSGCHTADARAERALELVMTTAGVRRGFLWICRVGKPQLAAPIRGDEPPQSVSSNVQTLVEEAHRAVRESSRFVATEDNTAWFSRVLACTERDKQVVVGAVALLQPEGQLPQPPGNLLEGIARRFYEAGDVALTPVVPL